MKLDLSPDGTHLMNAVTAVSWIALSLICALCRVDLQDQSTEIFPGNYGFEMSLLLCLLEFVVCLIILDVHIPATKSHLMEGVVICVLGQLGGSFLDNFWFSLHRMPAVVYSVGYFEPIIMSAITKICLDFTPTASAFAFLTTISVGAVGLSTHDFTLGLLNKSFSINFCLLIFYGIRNISFKSLQDEGVVINLRVKPLFAYSVSVVLFVLFSFFFISWEASSIILHGSIVTFTVTLTIYLSQKIIYAPGIIYLAILSVWAKLFINLFCVKYFEISHPVLSSLSFGTMTLGTVLYFGLTHTWTSDKKFNLGETFIRMEFLMFAAGICTLVFYVLQPRISERDLEALSYVRLDGLVRKLLQYDDSSL